MGYSEQTGGPTPAGGGDGLCLQVQLLLASGCGFAELLGKPCREGRGGTFTLLALAQQAQHQPPPHNGFQTLYFVLPTPKKAFSLSAMCCLSKPPEVPHNDPQHLIIIPYCLVTF